MTLYRVDVYHRTGDWQNVGESHRTLAEVQAFLETEAATYVDPQGFCETLRDTGEAFEEDLETGVEVIAEAEAPRETQFRKRAVIVPAEESAEIEAQRISAEEFS